MTRSASAILATSEFLYVDFLVHFWTDDRRCYRRTIKRWRAELQPLVTAYGQNFFESEALTLGDISVIDIDLHSRLDSILATAVDDDGVHRTISLQVWYLFFSGRVV